MPDQALVDRQRPLRKYAAVIGRKMTPSAKLLQRTLGGFADENDWLCLPEYQDLAVVMDVDRHTVSSAMDELLAHGLVLADGPVQAGQRILLATPESIDPEAVAAMAKVAESAGMAARGSGETRAERKAANQATWRERNAPNNPTALNLAKSTPDAERENICANLGNMKRYILFGQQGVADPAYDKPSHLNWMTVPVDANGNPKPELWNRTQFAGFWWWLVSWHRDGRGLPLTLPDWGRLIRDLNRSKLTNRQLYDFITVVIMEYDQIVEMCRNIEAPVLDDRSFTDNLLRTKVQQIQQQAATGGRRAPSSQAGYQEYGS